MHPQYTPSDISRFWSKVDRSNGPDACWEWTAYRDPFGYGSIHIASKTPRAHRVAWTLTNEAIPENMNVLHRCDNPSCCNPAHLFLGTDADNNRDRSAKHRSSYAPANTGSQNARAKLTEAQVLLIRQRHANGVTGAQLGREFGITGGNVSEIVRRKIWRHVP